ncbi:MAG: efflux RND transporter periplasmic adaptor subunit [Bacteroidetes bacterium]|nr:efflux RND transporter periplasmic adaptor subunit [Bacteroidota bacterium]
MQQILRITAVVSFLAVLTACGSGTKDSKGDLADKKAQLEKLKTQQKDLATQIDKLQDEIIKLDPSADNTKTKLVTLTPVIADTFIHYIDLQGKIDAQNVAMIAPSGQGGVVKAIFVKQGDVVKKGQLILKLDDAILKQTAAAAQQQLGGLKAQLAQAQSIYERQQNLWKQNIGTEVQVLNAKTSVDALQSQLNAAEANARAAQEQLNTANVYAGISGTIDQVNVKMGEFFSPQSAAVAQSGIRIVGTGDLKAIVQVPEKYLSLVNVGSIIRITLPEANNKTITTKVTVAGKLIDPQTRSFYVEANLPHDKDFHPNQMAVVNIKDYSAANAITIPVNTIQNDEKGKYVLVAATENGRLVARKKEVEVGDIYKDKLEVKSGLQVGDKLITDGFQGLYDGQPITTEIK